MNTLILVIAFFSFAVLKSDETVMLMGRQAEALAAAQEISSASALYAEMLKRPLPPWQRARVLYNLGTLHLTQDQPMQALEFYSQISLTDLSIPAFQRNLFINQGIAYVQQAQQAAEVFDLADILSTEALKFFNYARDLDCEIQKQDQEKTSEFMCQPNHLIEGWMHQAIEIRQARDRKKEERKVVQSLEKSPQDSLTSGSNAISILQDALAQAQKSLRFLFVYDPSYGSFDVTTFKDLQTEVIRRAELFIPAVLQEQRGLFSQRGTASSRCQQQPWDQVIPLFDRGDRAIQSVQQDLGKFPEENLQALAKQEQAVQDWHDALQLLLHPPHPQLQKEPSENRSSEDIHETLRLIQEMHQEDQPLQETKNEELHTW